MRVVHTPTGVSAKASRERSQALNKAAALALVKEKLLARGSPRVAEVAARARARAPPPPGAAPPLRGIRSRRRARRLVSRRSPRCARRRHRRATARGRAFRAPPAQRKDVRSGAETSRADAVLDDDAAELDEPSARG